MIASKRTTIGKSSLFAHPPHHLQQQYPHTLDHKQHRLGTKLIAHVRRVKYVMPAQSDKKQGVVH
jgi:hypothetical protein